jgi:hypothetical protein
MYDQDQHPTNCKFFEVPANFTGTLLKYLVTCDDSAIRFCHIYIAD